MAKNTDEKLNILEAVKAFAKYDISKAGINLFSKLGYDTSLQAPLDDKTYHEFKETYIEGSPNAERFNEEKALVEDWKSIDILFQLTNESFNGTKSLFEPSVNPYEPQSYLCFAIELNNSEYSKSHIANITREVNKLFSIPIIIIFKYGECITLAIINRRVNKRNSDRDVLEKVTLIKDIFFEKPHRAHIEILFDMSLPQLSVEYQINNFDSLHKAWSEVLDTQTLNKRFYTELSNWYFWAIKTVVYPGYEYEAQRNSLFTKEEKVREHNAKNLIRLLTRLLFVWFIKEKDLIPDELFDEKSIKNLITSFEPEKFYRFEDIAVESKSIYYKAILQNLFFASLNAEHGKRAFRINGQNQNATSLMRYQRYHKNPEAFVKLIESKVPFMNGGLFECLDHQDDELKGKKGGAVIDYEDGFSDRKDNELFVPDYVFFGKDVKVDLSTEYDDKKKKDVTVNGIINILQKYKFTIAENTPVEEDIALDPELLGRVFENLLASYNPETKTNARKQTGSFYTPRPIVEYMVDESLKAYLKTKIKDAALSKETLEDKTKAVEEIEKSLDSKLDNLIAYNESEPEFSEAERFQILKYIDECKILDPACGSGAFPMGILQKMVYVIHKLDPQNDNWKQIQIQKISNDSKLNTKEKNELQKELLTVFDENELDYARKLYLIENCIHGIDIQPIATQISRLRFFISLIVDQKVDGNKANFGVRPLPNLENRFVTANSLIGLNDEQAYLSSKEVDDLMLTLQKVRHDLFKAKTPRHKFELRQEDKRIRDELEQELLKLGFGKENAKLISTWDPYDKNRSAEFFDAEWMFGIKDGFDIIIANPPYIEFKKQSQELKDSLKNYETAKGKFDVFVCFIEKSSKLLKQSGVHCFINPTSFMKRDYGEAIRKYICKNFLINQIIDFADAQVFDTALTYTGIFIFQKNQIFNKSYNFEYQKFISGEEVDDSNKFESISTNYKDVYEVNSEKLDNQTWNLSFGIKEQIFEKMKSKSLPLEEIVEGIYQGIATGKDDVFVVSEDVIDEYNLERQLLHPFLKGKDIEPYKINNMNRYVIYPYSQYGEVINEKELSSNYPNIYKYLKDNKKNLSGRGYFEKSTKLWFELWNQRNLSRFAQEKLVTLDNACKNSFAYDNDNFLGTTTVYSIILKDKYKKKIKSILGILNSKLLTFYHQNNTVPQAGGFYRYQALFIKDLPICIPENTDIDKLVNEMMNYKINNKDTKDLETRINTYVYELYGLTEEEIAIVEGK